MKLLKLNLTSRAKFSLYLLMLVLSAQIFIGIKVVHNSVPVELGSLHQVGAVTVLTAGLFALHSCRKLDTRHLKNIFVKLRDENPQLYRDLLNKYKGANPDQVVKDLEKYRRKKLF